MLTLAITPGISKRCCASTFTCLLLALRFPQLMDIVLWNVLLHIQFPTSFIFIFYMRLNSLKVVRLPLVSQPAFCFTGLSALWTKSVFKLAPFRLNHIVYFLFGFSSFIVCKCAVDWPSALVWLWPTRGSYETHFRGLFYTKYTKLAQCA